MSVQTTDVVTIRPLGNNLHMLTVKGSATGDGSGGNIYSSIDYINYITQKDKLWLVSFGAMSNNAATDKCSITFNPNQWNPYYQQGTTFHLKGGLMTEGGVTGYEFAFGYQFNPYFYLGEPSQPTQVLTPMVYILPNTTSKVYLTNMIFIFRRPYS